MSKVDEDGEKPMAEAVSIDKGPDRNEMASEYMPDSTEWEAKTVLDLTDPAAVAGLSQLGEFYPEVDDLQQPIDDFLEMFLKSRTSVGGASRDEYQGILQSMFGSNPDDSTASQLATLFAGDLDDD